MKTVTELKAVVKRITENYYTAHLEQIVYVPNSLPLIDSTLNGKTTIKHGLTREAAIKHVTSLAPKAPIVFK